MEMVNVELDPFLDLLNQGDFDELTMKHIILNLAKGEKHEKTRFRIDETAAEGWTDRYRGD